MVVFNRRYLARQDAIRSRYAPEASKAKRLAAKVVLGVDEFRSKTRSAAPSIDT